MQPQPHGNRIYASRGPGESSLANAKRICRGLELRSLAVHPIRSDCRCGSDTAAVLSCGSNESYVRRCPFITNIHSCFVTHPPTHTHRSGAPAKSRVKPALNHAAVPVPAAAAPFAAASSSRVAAALAAWVATERSSQPIASAGRPECNLQGGK